MFYSQQPMSGGLQTAASLLAWTPGNDPINVSSVPLATRGGMPSTSRVIATGGGYAPGFDADSQGGQNQDIDNFDRWPYVDMIACMAATFAIPPVVWTNAAHRNGVLSLGGIFTYDTPNFNDFNTLMADEATAMTAANQLAAIAQYYGFDGYLVDIESWVGNIGGGTINVKSFQLFLSTLRAGLQANSPSSFLMYYETIDGLSDTGNVDSYRNQLTSTNQMFLQSGSTIVSDGMFCNYYWDAPMIDSSKKLAQQLGRSPLDVYMGVEVGASGAGTWQTAQPAVQNGVSLALWGSDWPFASRTDDASYDSLMDAFWGSGLDPQSGLAAVIEPRPTPLALPFCTTFNQGQGRMFYWPLHGTEAYGSNDWNNLSLQDVVTTYHDSVWTASGNADAFTLDVSYDLALDGGSSLLLSAGSDAAKGAFSVVDLYLTAWPLANGLEVSYALQAAQSSSADIAVGLVLDDSNETILLLTPSPSTAFSSLTISGHDVVVVEASSTTTIQVPPSQSPNPWTLRSYTNLPATYSTNNVVEVLAVAVVLGDAQLAAGSPQLYLGELVVAEGSGLTTTPSSATNLAVEAEWVTLPQGGAAANIELSWNAPSTGTVRAYDISYVYTVGGQASQTWLGRTTNTTYWIGQFVYSIPAGQSWPGDLQFVVQVIGGNGVEQSVTDAASVWFTWSPPAA